MISKSQITHVRALHQKKFRQESGLFLVEGSKAALEVLKGGHPFVVESIFGSADWLDKNAATLETFSETTFETSEKDMERISALSTPSDVLLVLKEPAEQSIPTPIAGHWALALDGIRDPGNLGTLLRIADWYGITDVYCSEDSAEVHNPKTIMSTMGSFLRVRAHKCSLSDVFSQSSKIPVYGALLGGKSVYDTDFTTPGFLLIGNEAQGIRPDLLDFVSNRVFLPGKGGAESLNASVAGGILCSWAIKC